jgi:hypothetical protein
LLLGYRRTCWLKNVGSRMPATKRRRAVPLPTEIRSARRALIVATGAVLLAFGTLRIAVADQDSRVGDPLGKLLDEKFPLNASADRYYSKLVLRFRDTREQLVVICYAGGKTELIRYQLAGISDVKLDKLLADAASSDDKELKHLLDNLTVDVSRWPIDHVAYDAAEKRLMALRVSPIRLQGICVDDCEQVELWYDNGQDSAHYTLFGGDKHSEDGQLMQWVDYFRKNYRRWLLSRPGGAE